MSIVIRQIVQLTVTYNKGVKNYIVKESRKFEIVFRKVISVINLTAKRLLYDDIADISLYLTGQCKDD